jgi:hypothetical protein
MERPWLPPWAARFCDLLFAVLALGAIKRTFHDSQLNDEDFHVYWQAAHRWLTGTNPYAFTAADQGFVFKYPPWLLPLFIPIGLLTFETARVVWYCVEWACIAYAILWCVRQGAKPRLAVFVAFVFWWMFHAHFSAGQFTLVMLVAALWTFPRPEGHAGTFGALGIREALLAYVLSAKVFSLYTLAGIWRRFLKPGPWIAGLSLFAVTHLILLAVSLATGGTSILGTYRAFMTAAASGGAELGAIIVRGQGNHGLTALVLRTLGVDSLSFTADILTSAALAIVLGSIWTRVSGPLSDAERWSGWIGVGLIVHPLAWHHSFVLAYPLCALSLQRTVLSGRKSRIALSLLGACCIGIFIPQVLGKTIVKPLELAGIKSWGVILAATALVLAARQAAKKPSGFAAAAAEGEVRA